MTGPSSTSLLRQLDTNGFPGAVHPLSTQHEVTIGRDPQCQVVLDSTQFGGVSRRHVAVRPLYGQSPPIWQVCDLSSANGTFINGQRLQGCQTLRPGDCIELGQGGAQFVFESYGQVPAPGGAASYPNSGGYSTSPPQHLPAPASSSDVTLSQLLPIMSTPQELVRKAYLIPGILTVLFVVLMFVFLGKPVLFNLLIAAYIGLGAYYFIYQLCGKRKPWWLLAGAALMTMVFLGVIPVFNLFSFVFRTVLPGGGVFEENLGFGRALIAHFFGAGLCEESFKALPVFAAYWWGQSLRSPARERLGVWEPLDGILLATASAVGFTWLETLGQYLPSTVMNAAQLTGSEGLGELVGLQLLIPRVLGSVAGHMAYSGYFGYFIGLSILKPAKRWRILAIGWLTASVLHAIWNSASELGYFGFIISVLIGILSYAFLGAAILKARTLSPNRSENFATRIANLP